MANFYTRFRAYQLQCSGASFSYAVDGNFLLIEARYNECNRRNILEEMQLAGCQKITKLHITSWDVDHCNPTELTNILIELKPAFIEYPGYEPDSDSGKDCKKMIINYIAQSPIAQGCAFSPTYINTLPLAEEKKYTDIVYNPREASAKVNDNSVVKLFRKGRFSVLSLGDCESGTIRDRLASDTILQSETDVMLVAHHGADNGFTTLDFVKAIRPKIAICACDWNNRYGHVEPMVRNVFLETNIPLFTTKSGDVIVVCGTDNNAMVYNLNGNNTKVENKKTFRPKMLI